MARRTGKLAVKLDSQAFSKVKESVESLKKATREDLDEVVDVMSGNPDGAGQKIAQSVTGASYGLTLGAVLGGLVELGATFIPAAAPVINSLPELKIAYGTLCGIGAVAGAVAVPVALSKMKEALRGRIGKKIDSEGRGDSTITHGNPMLKVLNLIKKEQDPQLQIAEEDLPNSNELREVMVAAKVLEKVSKAPEGIVFSTGAIVRGFSLPVVGALVGLALAKNASFFNSASSGFAISGAFAIAATAIGDFVAKKFSERGLFNADRVRLGAEAEADKAFGKMLAAQPAIQASQSQDATNATQQSNIVELPENKRSGLVNVALKCFSFCGLIPKTKQAAEVINDGAEATSTSSSHSSTRTAATHTKTLETPLLPIDRGVPSSTPQKPSLLRKLANCCRRGGGRGGNGDSRSILSDESF